MVSTSTSSSPTSTPGSPARYSISELAQEFGISTRTIRFYEEKGFIKPQRKGQRRIYCSADRTRIRLILRGKRIGLSLAESVAIIDMYDARGSDAAQRESLIARIETQRLALLQQRRDLDEMLKALDEVEKLCRSDRSSRAARKNRGGKKSLSGEHARSATGASYQEHNL